MTHTFTDRLRIEIRLLWFALRRRFCFHRELAAQGLQVTRSHRLREIGHLLIICKRCHRAWYVGAPEQLRGAKG